MYPCVRIPYIYFRLFLWSLNFYIIEYDNENFQRYGGAVLEIRQNYILLIINTIQQIGWWLLCLKLHLSIVYIGTELINIILYYKIKKNMPYFYLKRGKPCYQV